MSLVSASERKEELGGTEISDGAWDGGGDREQRVICKASQIGAQRNKSYGLWSYVEPVQVREGVAIRPRKGKDLQGHRLGGRRACSVATFQKSPPHPRRRGRAAALER